MCYKNFDNFDKSWPICLHQPGAMSGIFSFMQFNNQNFLAKPKPRRERIISPYNKFAGVVTIFFSFLFFLNRSELWDPLITQSSLCGKSEPEKLRVSYNSLNNILAPDDNWKYNTGRQRISVSNIIMSYNLQQF